MTELLNALEDGRLFIFATAEWYCFLVAYLGTAIAAITIIETMHDVRTQRRLGLNGRLRLVALKNFWFSTLIGGGHLIVAYTWAFAVTQPPTASQLFPSTQTNLFYASSMVSITLVTVAVCVNYVCYRKINNSSVEDLRGTK